VLAPADLRWSNATPLDCLFGRGRQAVKNSTLGSGPNTQFEALPMQLADHVEQDVQRSVGGREATAHPVVCSRHLASHCRLVSTSHVSPLCESTNTIAPTEFSTAFQ
jgi:hypothetical protein